ncbi:hypothetical protein AYL99_09796 [Fonsecaea erecta]|uniref:Uncharacterized protein n=1 Tax=Fonsecaea erecta TaxID=1367422 RepID=A0A178Z793_9EURO|nr:hypothetical protein AYL99_09796 [Fonsecaea erecta]OAP55644.1 hypothetical protein AYL99_09796 [Fonsecaea erecta]
MDLAALAAVQPSRPEGQPQANIHVIGAQQVNPNKRRRTGRGSSQGNSKRTKCSRLSSSEPHYPPAFWDNLSCIHLQEDALEELERRNRQVPGTRDCFHLSDTALPEKRSALLSLDHCVPDHLRELEQLASAGGPDLSALRGFRAAIDPQMPWVISVHPESRSHTSDSNPASTSQPTESTGPYSRNFQQNLLDGAVYPPGYKFSNGRLPNKPHNWEVINTRLKERRGSLSSSTFSEAEHTDFVQRNDDAAKKKQVITSVIPIIEGCDHKCVCRDVPFTNLDHLTDGTLAPGRPDICYGARPEQLDRRVLDELSKSIVPSTQDENLPVVPNFFLAVTSPSGLFSTALRQATYDGALGERGVLRLLSFGETADPVFDNNAHTISSIYLHGMLTLYTVYSSPSAGPGSRPAYFMHQLRSFAMHDSPETFRAGATAYRNARDWAEEQRDAAIKQSNERVNDRQRTALAAETTTVEQKM